MQDFVETDSKLHFKVLADVSKPICDRFISLYCLRTIGTMEAVEFLFNAFNEEKESDLLKHEICYCLG